MMNKTERTELQRLVRGRMKVLRTEVDQRGAEMLAEVDEQIAARFSDQDRTWQNVIFLAEQAVLEANRKVYDALRESGYTMRGDTEPILVDLNRHRMTQPPGDRHQLRQAAMTKIGAQMQAAKVRLAAQEQDLLQELALGVLESDEARGFLARIPTVGELVPGARLAALEQQLDDDGPILAIEDNPPTAASEHRHDRETHDRPGLGAVHRTKGHLPVLPRRGGRRRGV